MQSNKSAHNFICKEMELERGRHFEFVPRDIYELRAQIKLSGAPSNALGFICIWKASNSPKAGCTFASKEEDLRTDYSRIAFEPQGNRRLQYDSKVLLYRQMV